MASKRQNALAKLANSWGDAEAPERSFSLPQGQYACKIEKAQFNASLQTKSYKGPGLRIIAKVMRGEYTGKTVSQLIFLAKPRKKIKTANGIWEAPSGLDDLKGLIEAFELDLDELSEASLKKVLKKMIGLEVEYFVSSKGYPSPNGLLDPSDEDDDLDEDDDELDDEDIEEEDENEDEDLEDEEPEDDEEEEEEKPKPKKKAAKKKVTKKVTKKKAAKKKAEPEPEEDDIDEEDDEDDDLDSLFDDDDEEL